MANTITLEDLRPAEGSTHKSKRVGRGRSSGHGKTSCRGHNGEGQRSGSASKRGFEGGQMPAYRRLPKLKGFQIINKIKYAEVNVARLDAYKLKEVSLESLIAVLKRTIDKAPTIPSDKAILFPITVITTVVNIVNITNETLNFLL